MKYPKLRELKEAVTSLVTPAYTSRFPVEEHVPFKDFRGKPVVDDNNCVGCETCANVCPPLAITFTDDKERKSGQSGEITGNASSVVSARNIASPARG
ncbi:MAG: 4Fe-4S binding protein [Bacteroidales bacterium]